jgi:hypothetical protein
VPFDDVADVSVELFLGLCGCDSHMRDHAPNRGWRPSWAMSSY